MGTIMTFAEQKKKNAGRVRGDGLRATTPFDT